MNGQFTPDAALVPLMTPELRASFDASARINGIRTGDSPVERPHLHCEVEVLKRLLAAADLPQVNVEEDSRPGMSGNRHIVYNDGADRLCFMAHSNGRHPKRDEARAYLIATALNALPALLASLSTGEGDKAQGDVELQWFGQQRNLELFFHIPVYADDDDDTQEWRVSKVSGPINDREWETVGRGASPIEAIKSAYAALSDKAA